MDMQRVLKAGDAHTSANHTMMAHLMTMVDEYIAEAVAAGPEVADARLREVGMDKVADLLAGRALYRHLSEEAS